MSLGARPALLIRALLTEIPARRASFDVALALVERPKGPKGTGICLAQAEGLGNLWRYVLRAEGPTVC